MKTNYYNILGIEKGATEEEIKKAYKNKAIIWHPDKNKAPEAIKRFKEISEAYQILSDREKRCEYDRSTERGKQYEYMNGMRDPFEVFREVATVMAVIEEMMTEMDIMNMTHNCGVVQMGIGDIAHNQVGILNIIPTEIHYIGGNPTIPEMRIRNRTNISVVQPMTREMTQNLHHTKTRCYMEPKRRNDQMNGYASYNNRKETKPRYVPKSNGMYKNKQTIYSRPRLCKSKRFASLASSKLEQINNEQSKYKEYKETKKQDGREWIVYKNSEGIIKKVLSDEEIEELVERYYNEDNI